MNTADRLSSDINGRLEDEYNRIESCPSGESVSREERNVLTHSGESLQ